MLKTSNFAQIDNFQNLKMVKCPYSPQIFFIFSPLKQNTYPLTSFAFYLHLLHPCSFILSCKLLPLSSQIIKPRRIWSGGFYLGQFEIVKDKTWDRLLA
jgi:hypothetical protein